MGGTRWTRSRPVTVSQAAVDTHPEINSKEHIAMGCTQSCGVQATQVQRLARRLPTVSSRPPGASPAARRP